MCCALLRHQTTACCNCPSGTWIKYLTGLTFFSAAATTITRLRSCWTEAGQCSGSRWPPVGCVSSSTCGPSSLPWSARSASKPKGSRTSVAGILLNTVRQRWDAEPRNLCRSPLPWNTTLFYPQHSKWSIICCLLLYTLVFLLCFTM